MRGRSAGKMPRFQQLGKRPGRQRERAVVLKYFSDAFAAQRGMDFPYPVHAVVRGMNATDYWHELLVTERAG